MSDENRRQGESTGEPPFETFERRSLLRLGGAVGGTLALSGCTFLGSEETSGEEPSDDDDESADGDEPMDDEDSIGEIAESPRPGPAFLYEDAATPPQFENTKRWEAEPLLVSGTEAHVDGEYLYQGFANDDYGARTGDTDQTQVRVQPPADRFSPAWGSLTYPTDADRFGYDAADPIEFRAAPVEDGIKYRITLNTMLEPDVAGIAVGIDTDGEAGDEPDDWGYGLGTLGELGLDHVLVTWGTGAELDGDAAGVESTVDVERNQIEVTVPLEPDGETWRHYMVAGLFDADETRFREVLEEPTETNPGGANGRNPPPVFSVGFRAHEQEPLGGVDPSADAPADQLRDEAGEPIGFWRDVNQANALARRDISSFFADIDFEALENGETRRDLPDSGYLNLLYGSRYDVGEGIEIREGGDEDEVVMTGRVQPYAVYVPKSAADDEPSTVHLHMHSSTSNYNQYGVSSPNALRQLGEEREAIVLTPQGRGPQIGYGGVGGVDVLEALSDLDSRFGVDFERLTLGGYSLGGFGTFDIAGRYPDLFARGFTVVAATTDTRLLDNFRHVPLLVWNAIDDETVPIALSDGTHDYLAARGYRHRYARFPGYGHLTLSEIDQWDDGQAFLEGEFLGDDTVETAPAQVTFRRSPDLELTEYDFVHTGAYWIDDVEVADDSDSGLVDAYSTGVGEARPEAETETGSDTHAGTEYEYTQIEWSEPDEGPDADNRLEVELEGVTAATIYVDEAALDATEAIDLEVDSTHEAELVLESGGGTETVAVETGETSESVEIV